MYFEFAIIGTTASGKSDFALKLAKDFNGIILSLDSLCLYKDINIASAKPSNDDLNAIFHFGINLVRIDEDFCVWDFIKEYQNAKDFAIKNNCPLIITGGSGFYLKTMMNGLSPKLEATISKPSDDEIWDLALKIDKNFTSKFSKNDKFRLKKWYQIYENTKEIPSKWLRENTSPAIIKNLPIYELIWEKEELKERIKTRTKKMIKDGLLNEAKELFSHYSQDLKPLKSIGLKECKQYLEGKYGKICDDFYNLELKSSLNLLFEQICIHSNQLAKRQRTFNNSQFKNKIKLDGKNPELNIKDILK